MPDLSIHDNRNLIFRGRFQRIISPVKQIASPKELSRAFVYNGVTLPEKVRLRKVWHGYDTNGDTKLRREMEGML
jgi:hypothetical protein